MAGIKDVARVAGVSIGTVSNVVNRPHVVSAATRSRVQSVIEELGYVRDESARQLRAGRSRTLALLVLDLGNPFFVDIARGAEEAAYDEGLNVITCNSGQRGDREAAHLAMLAEQRVRGVLLSPVDNSGRGLKDLRRSGIPYVFVDRSVPTAEACSVSVDDVAGGTLAARHLVEAGHRRIAFVNGPSLLVQCRDRERGVREALAEAPAPGRTLSVVEVSGLDVASGRDAGARLLGISPRPTAVFCANDLLALGVLQAMVAAGVRVPDEMAIVGYDDIEFAAAAAVPLTSVRQPAARLGRTATELLIAETVEPENGLPSHEHQAVVYSPELVVRDSTRVRR
ncbi:LacI family DNA-binding transcriptional regulator [Amycolatopsis sp. H20-H5]|uniref:LacI family DNA-binding transcriptional regulator n=1 Tax=Amycolatopsis sp. H20-H5 TaxID=3046309 RepID=UPI002DB86985|nr:LacI family DNA-binding transcriptional regulator [Amycolatopsis sp. H20-H5]MEC3978683.1 LacI family DNA-binding transcriptional regulator [Amycolatopsis sp. H20-H5]